MIIFLAEYDIFVIIYQIRQYHDQIEKDIKMDKNEFFREATLRICGNLEIEEAMFSTLQFLRQAMPVYWMAIEH